MRELRQLLCEQGGIGGSVFDMRELRGYLQVSKLRQLLCEQVRTGAQAPRSGYHKSMRKVGELVTWW